MNRKAIPKDVSGPEKDECWSKDKSIWQKSPLHITKTFAKHAISAEIWSEWGGMDSMSPMQRLEKYVPHFVCFGYDEESK
jgi:hypothetical protein